MKKHAKKLVVLLLTVAMLIPTVGMIFSSAADNSYPVELAYNNLFVFEKWANNDLSTTVIGYKLNADQTITPYPNNSCGTVECDIQNGSFRMTKTNMDATEIYTAYSGDVENPEGNIYHYSMSVEPNTTYAFSYNVTGNIWAFTPFVFFYTTDGLYYSESFVNYATPAYNVNTFNFTTPANVDRIQIRFTIGDTSTTRPDKTSVYADVSDIMIYKVEYSLSETNLFNYDSWSGNTNSATVHAYYGGGTLTTNPDEKSLTFTTNGTLSPAPLYLFTNFSSTSTAGYYSIAVTPGKTYSFKYTLTDCTIAPTDYIPHFALYDSDGNLYTNPITSWYYINQPATGEGENNWTFTVPDNVYYIQPVFALSNATLASGKTVTVSEIGLYEVLTFEHKVTPHRGVFTYDHSDADSNFYGDDGELPTPTAPEGYVFGGWYTGENGTGTRITPETKIHYSSMTVYANYEPAVDSLEIATPITKTVYTVGEKLDTTGLSLKATVNGSSFNINSDIYCTPLYLEEAGTQTITAHYGGKTVTFTVSVRENESSSIIFNGVEKNVLVANKNYVINEDVSAFNRYELTYSTNSYVKGTITFNGGHSEDFFLEPSDNGTFASYVDEFVYDKTFNKVVAVKFTCLDNELGTFQLKSLKTVMKDGYGKTVYFTNSEYKLGVALEYGGVVSELYDIDDPVVARVYEDPEGRYYYDANGNRIDRKLTLVDYSSKLDELEKNDSTLARTGETSSSVNLINTLDRGRYLQQSYYGTYEKPYVQSSFNRAPWNYNPVQGGNVAEEASKVVDYEITDTYIYVKARPLDWAKWSDDHANSGECTHKDADGNIEHTEALWGDGYITDTYVEAWYYFDNGMIKVTNRKVDYSGLPEYYTTQEMPALYLIEPLNHFVYSDVTEAEAWTKDADSLENIEEPEFWGIVPDYIEEHKDDVNTDVNVDCYENWAAFTASEDADSFGVGIYSPGVTDFFYGVMPQVYAELPDGNGGLIQSDSLNYRHAETVDPAPEMPTSYIAPIGKMTFRSYEPTSYTYYLTTGTSEEIYSDFRNIGDKEAEIELAKTKIAVPETVYMKPADASTAGTGLGNATVGQYYVNNIMNENDFYNVETEAKPDETNMYFGIHVDKATSFTVSVTNVTDSTNDIILGNADGTGNLEGQTFSFDTTDTFITSGEWSLRFANGVEPNKIATAKWDITVTLDNGTTETFTVYTVLYTPMKTVGAVAESRRNSSTNNEISSWITGANGIDHSQRSPLGQFKGDVHDSGYFKYDPLTNSVPSGIGSSESSSDYIITTDPSSWGNVDGTMSDDYSENAYVLQTRPEAEDSTRAQSYLGLLTVDKSRYTNTNQIPNFKLGYDYLRVGDNENDSSDEYNTYYTLGTNSAFTAGITSNGDNMKDKPSGWTTLSSYGRGEVSVPSRETTVPAYDVSTIDGMYIHALGWTECKAGLYSRWATAGTSVLCSVTDKSGLREAVLEVYNQYNESRNPGLVAALENAATVLGNPAATTTEIDAARKALNDILDVEVYTLKYDNLFSAYEFSLQASGMKMVKAVETKENDNKAVYDDKATAKYNDRTITINSNHTTAEDHNVYTHFGPLDNYYNIPVTGGTEYVFEYYVTSTGGSQAHIFFYDENGSENLQLTTYESITGAAIDHDPLFNFIGAYTQDVYNNRVIIKFTAPANAAKATFRFGNIYEASNKSTFSNIRFCEAKNYSEEVVYSTTKEIFTEDLYNEHTAYGTLMSPTRIGFDFLGWLYDFDDKNSEVKATDLASAHTSIFSNWYEHEYKIIYKANGGTGSDISTDYNKYTSKFNLANSGFSKTDYILAGWSTDPNATIPEYQLGQNVTRLTPDDKVTINLYAVWVLDTVNVTFDNLFDLNAFNISTTTLEILEETDTGFTVKALPSGRNDANTDFGITIPVEAGKTYILSADIDFTPAASGNTFDMYINARNSSNTNEDSFTLDPNCGAHTEGSDIKPYMSKSGTASTDNFYIKFTAGSTTANVRIRFDANIAGSELTVENIRFYEDTGISVSPVNKQVILNHAFDTLPVPTKSGYVFAGWYHGDALVTSATIATIRETYNLTSKWVAPEEVLDDDTVVVDFTSPIDTAPLGNDATLVEIAENTESTYKLVGVSADGTNYSTTANGTYGTFSVSGNNVAYTPSNIMNGVDTIRYKASITYPDSTTAEITDTITVAPASNILYEEDKFTVANASGVEWKDTSTNTTGNGKQDAYPDPDGVEVYGYDSSYDKIENYSNGSALSVTVNSTNKRSQNISFDFEGTGFDLNGACGYNTGVMIVSLRDNNYVNAEGKNVPKVIKSYIVDTYYGDYNDDGASKYASTLYQVPIINETALSHSNYTIQIVASWLPSMSGALSTNSVSTQALGNGMTANIAEYANSEELREALADIGMAYVLDAEDVSVVWFDEDSVLNGGEGANTVEEGMLKTQAVTELVNVVDSVRVYNPITDGDQYYIASEQGVRYYNVIDNLTTTDSYLSGTGLFAYVMGTDKQDITVENYNSIGPKDELYLTSGTGAVTFTINNLDKSKSKVMISLRAASGKPTVSIGNGYTDTIESNTEMYYDITQYVGDDGTVVIKNTTAGTLLSVGSVKISGVAQPAMLSLFNLDTALAMMNAPATPVELNAPQTEPDVEKPEDTTDPTEPEDTTDPTEPEDTTDPTEPEDTTDPDDSEETTNPNGSDEPGETDDSTECWLVRLINWIIAMLKKIFSAINSFLGF